MVVKKILLAYDGSAGSKDAARAAAEVASRYDAEVTVFTVGGPLFGAAMQESHVPHMTEHDYDGIAGEGLAILAEHQVRSHKFCPGLTLPTKFCARLVKANTT